MKGLLEPLTAIHAIGDVQAEHPVVGQIPETGQRVLDVNPTFTKRITGLRPRERERILAMLFETGRSPEFEVRWHWSEGDIAIWDNRCRWHYATADHGATPRIGHRVALRGATFG